MKRLISAFHEQADRTPDVLAITFEGTSLTYRQLGARASRLAGALRAEGVGPDTGVAISVERSLDLAVAVLGVLEAGGGYLPLDVGYPKDRRAFMLEGAQGKVLVTQ